MSSLLTASSRKTKIVATLGPASSDLKTIKGLVDAGANVFRFNLSHGSHEDHKARLQIVRRIERESGRPIAVLLDLQGPKLRIGTVAEGVVTLEAGDTFRLDLDPQPGDKSRVNLPHPEIFEALVRGADLLIDDGKVRLKVLDVSAEHATTRVVVGGTISDRKGVNVPSVVLPIPALTPKDRVDLQFGLDNQVDWIALSFVQREEDVREVKAIVQGRAGVLAKLEKPAALSVLDAIVAEADAIMVARGDLGVEVPAEQVPSIQKRIVRTCRAAGKPVIVATQMLESMIGVSVPTRAEASDVATAAYDGADAVMLSAESASGKYPKEAVAVMDRILRQVESDPFYRSTLDASYASLGSSTVSDAICASMRQATGLLRVAAIVTYTRSGYTSLRAARERLTAPVVCMTPEISTARRLTLAWGVHSVHAPEDIRSVDHMVEAGCAIARRNRLASTGHHVLVASGTPFGTAGTTNFLHIAKA